MMIARACERLGWTLAGQRCAVQGFGNVGGIAAGELDEQGLHQRSIELAFAYSELTSFMTLRKSASQAAMRASGVFRVSGVSWAQTLSSTMGPGIHIDTNRVRDATLDQVGSGDRA